ncbi:MAG: hypothetical protein FWF95_04145 [Syntrophorhabdaceae bacterium]|nr:hypothetical protein [Syntrophorhabdaceae bacterium]
MNVSQSAFTHDNPSQQLSIKNAIQKHVKHQQNKQLNNHIFKKTGNIEYSVQISSDGKQKAKNVYDELQQMANKLKGSMEQLNELSEQGQGAAESAKIRMICMKIALRIMSGDNVPVEDHQYLLKHDPTLYAEAMAHRLFKEKPEDHDRLSEDEKSDDSNGSALDNPAQFDSGETNVEEAVAV